MYCRCLRSCSWMQTGVWTQAAGCGLSCSSFSQQFFHCYCPVGFGRRTDPSGDYIRYTQSAHTGCPIPTGPSTVVYLTDSLVEHPSRAARTSVRFTWLGNSLTARCFSIGRLTGGDMNCSVLHCSPLELVYGCVTSCNYMAGSVTVSLIPHATSNINVCVSRPTHASLIQPCFMLLPRIYSRSNSGSNIVLCYYHGSNLEVTLAVTLFYVITKDLF
jgi:hypothetical protein